MRSPGDPPGRLRPNKLPFFGAKGSDPDAPMKGDHQQQVIASTAPRAPVVKPKGVKSGGAYKLPRTRRG